MRTELNNGREFELEAQYGLPESLPEGEYVIWQGSPDVWRMAKEVFYIRPVIAYFVFLMVFSVFDGIALEHTIPTIVISAAWMFALSLVCIGLLYCLAYFTATTTVYTMTNRRIVMRIGIALTLSFNLPFKEIISADFKEKKDGFGNIPLRISTTTKIAYFHLWPHARPLRFNNPEPMLRNIKNVKDVATLLTNAWATENKIAVTQAPVKSPMSNPEIVRSGLGVGLSNDLGLT
ncbi:MAG: photosynthetic complex putative assembly protein PuhB [Betaproteobacteria bacterium]|jgi:hypothetical protein